MLGSGDADWLAREVPIVSQGTGPWGRLVDLGVDAGAVERVLEHSPSAVMLSFGDPSPFAERIRRGARR